MSVQTARNVATCILLVHHLFVWVNLGRIDVKGHRDKDASGKLEVFTGLATRFLTNWNFFGQTVYMTVALALQQNWPQKWQKHLASCKKINWNTFWSFVLPWSVFIPLIFWTIFSYDRELICPRILDAILPLWMNHSLHTNIILLVLLELLLAKEKPPDFYVALRTLSASALLYLFVLVFTFFNDSVWLYGFLTVFSWPQRFAFFIGVYLFLVAVMRAAIALQNFKVARRRVKQT